MRSARKRRFHRNRPTHGMRRVQEELRLAHANVQGDGGSYQSRETAPRLTVVTPALVNNGAMVSPQITNQLFHKLRNNSSSLFCHNLRQMKRIKVIKRQRVMNVALEKTLRIAMLCTRSCHRMTHQHGPTGQETWMRDFIKDGQGERRSKAAMPSLPFPPCPHVSSCSVFRAAGHRLARETHGELL